MSLLVRAVVDYLLPEMVTAAYIIFIIVSVFDNISKGSDANCPALQHFALYKVSVLSLLPCFRPILYSLRVFLELLFNHLQTN